ncbi:LysR family transcriptional regulator [Brevibacillus migulae]|uniref:LysR family transcriptional regulator n=1 Tax=Brevibacillus migulae TaxID=1644114 RepID=UPI00106DF7F6|nr:LysR family transcriptional regulator [Brevibacillus migulae]
MDTRYLQTFREVAKWQSFTKAAEVLGYAQSSVTTQIQNIETEFGVTLFERWGRKIRLTHAGETLLLYTEQLLTLLDEAKGNLSEQAQLSGTLTIGTVESLAAFFLPPYLQIFQKEHPRIKLMLTPGVCQDLRRGVHDGSYDFAVVLDRLQDHPDLVTMNLGEEKLVVIAPSDHRLVHKDNVVASDFAGENWIFTEFGCSYRMMMETILRETGTQVASSLEFGSLEAIKQCVSYGLGIALLPMIAVKEEVSKGRLAILPFAHPEIRVYRQLIYHKKRWVTQAQKRLIDLLQTGSVMSLSQEKG